MRHDPPSPAGPPLAGAAGEVVASLDAAVSSLQELPFDQLTPEAELELVRRLEQVRRRLDHGTDRVAEQVESSGSFSLDGHRNARDTVKHLGRLPGGEALARLQTVRMLRVMPAVRAAYRRGDLPTDHVRAIARVTANPRVVPFLELADPIFAHRASLDTYDDFLVWLRQWENHADTDGAARDAEITHQRRRLSLTENVFDGSWTLDGRFGSAQGAALAEMLGRFEDAEFAADWANARAEFGDQATVEHLERTPTQRRADAMVAMARWAGAAPADGKTPAPLVNLVISQEAFERELARLAGADIADDPNADAEGRRCQTIDGTPLHPSDVVAAALVGHVRRVVVDGEGTVIDLGRRRRLFTGASRDAAELQAMLRRVGGLRCAWPGCPGHGGCLQADHLHPAARGGPTDVINSQIFCGFHNRLKEHGFKPVRGDDGEWTIHRPGDAGPVTPAA